MRCGGSVWDRAQRRGRVSDGVGTITRAALKRLHPEATLVAIEMNPPAPAAVATEVRGSRFALTRLRFVCQCGRSFALPSAGCSTPDSLESARRPVVGIATAHLHRNRAGVRIHRIVRQIWNPSGRSLLLRLPCNSRRACQTAGTRDPSRNRAILASPAAKTRAGDGSAGLFSSPEKRSVVVCLLLAVATLALYYPAIIIPSSTTTTTFT